MVNSNYRSPSPPGRYHSAEQDRWAQSQVTGPLGPDGPLGKKTERETQCLKSQP